MNLLIIFFAKYLIFIEAFIFGIYFILQPKPDKKNMVIFAAVTLPVIFILSRVAAMLYYDPRPFVVGHFVPLVSHAADNGFPSDHSLLASAIAACLIPFNKKYGYSLFAIGVLVAAGRVLAGVHHTVDVVFSFGISIFTSSAVYLLLKNRKILQKGEQKL